MLEESPSSTYWPEVNSGMGLSGFTLMMKRSGVKAWRATTVALYFSATASIWLAGPKCNIVFDDVDLCHQQPNPALSPESPLSRSGRAAKTRRRGVPGVAEGAR